MSRQAFLFPGQGSQYVGMGRSILERTPEASQLLEQANDMLRFDVGQMIREGPREPLSGDTYSQLATFVVNAICWSLWRDRESDPWAVMGYSMGFYSALMAAGVFDFCTGLAMVQEAARIMGEAASSRPGRMMALVGLAEAEVDLICQEVADRGYVGLANLNAARQFVISGDERAVEAAGSLALDRGALEVKEIEVRAAYHSPLMEHASRRFSAYLADIPMRDPNLPVLSYVDAEYVQDQAEARVLLSRQLTSRIRWKECIERLVREGVDCFIEVGPGEMLTRLTRWINRSVRAYATDDPEVLDRLLGEGRWGEAPAR